jgi:hypothetical protein
MLGSTQLMLQMAAKMGNGLKIGLTRSSPGPCTYKYCYALSSVLCRTKIIYAKQKVIGGKINIFILTG